MKVIEFLEENRSSLRVGLPIRLLDIIDERSVYCGSYEVLMEQLELVGLEHVRNARFLMEDMEKEQDCIVLLYMKDLEHYDDFDLTQFAAKMKRLELREPSLDEKLVRASEQSVGRSNTDNGRGDFGKI